MKKRSSILETALRLIAVDSARHDVREVTTVRNHPGEKKLHEAVLSYPLITALEDFASLVVETPWALAGGLAVNVYGKPRGTQDMDIWIASDTDLDAVVQATKSKFTRVSKHRLEHKATGVEVDLYTPEWIGMPADLIKSAIANVKKHDLGKHSVPVIDPRHLAAYKIERNRDIDRHDAKNLVRDHGPFDMADIPMSQSGKTNWQSLIAAMENEPLDPPDDPV